MDGQPERGAMETQRRGREGDKRKYKDTPQRREEDPVGLEFRIPNEKLY
jgi:hypothetical protein